MTPFSAAGVGASTTATGSGSGAGLGGGFDTGGVGLTVSRIATFSGSGLGAGLTGGGETGRASAVVGGAGFLSGGAGFVSGLGGGGFVETTGGGVGASGPPGPLTKWAVVTAVPTISSSTVSAMTSIVAVFFREEAGRMATSLADWETDAVDTGATGPEDDACATDSCTTTLAGDGATGPEDAEALAEAAITAPPATAPAPVPGRRVVASLPIASSADGTSRRAMPATRRSLVGAAAGVSVGARIIVGSKPDGAVSSGVACGPVPNAPVPVQPASTGIGVGVRWWLPDDVTLEMSCRCAAKASGHRARTKWPTSSAPTAAPERTSSPLSARASSSARE